VPDAEPSSIRLSWSRIRTHSECPQKGKLTAEGKRSAVSDHRVFFPGTVVDRCMRQWLSMPEQERGWMGRHVDVIMDKEEASSQENGDGKVKWKHPADRDEVRALCRQAVDRLEPDLADLLGLDKPPELQCGWDPAPRFEVPLLIPHPGGGPGRLKISITGEIDLLVSRPPGWAGLLPGLEIFDLKTTRDDQYWRKSLGQLVMYEIAMWGQKQGWAVRSGILQPLCADRTPSWAFTAEHRVQMFQRITQVAGDIWAGRLDPKPGSYCGNCDVRHACPLKGGKSGRVSGFFPPRTVPAA
jgi:hypothetical protein